jgi:hypothetical protein
MAKGHKTAARLPERSAVISGDESEDGLSPIAADTTTKPDCPACGTEPCAVHRPIKPYHPTEASAVRKYHPS